MSSQKRIEFALFFLRISVFLVMFLWTLDKFLNPVHAAKIYETFYFIEALGRNDLILLGVIEILILLCFILGIFKGISYGAVLLFQTVSTLSAYKQYLSPFSSNHLLFFSAWPMLAACFALWILRDLDTLCLVKKQ